MCVVGEGEEGGRRRLKGMEEQECQKRKEL